MQFIKSFGFRFLVLVWRPPGCPRSRRHGVRRTSRRCGPSRLLPSRPIVVMGHVALPTTATSRLRRGGASGRIQGHRTRWSRRGARRVLGSRSYECRRPATGWLRHPAHVQARPRGRLAAARAGDGHHRERDHGGGAADAPSIRNSCCSRRDISIRRSRSPDSSQDVICSATCRTRPRTAATTSWCGRLMPRSGYEQLRAARQGFRARPRCADRHRPLAASSGHVPAGARPAVAEGEPGRWRSRSRRRRRPAEEPVRVPAAPPPEVVFSTPTDDETDVLLSTNIRIQFSRDINQATLKGRIRARSLESQTPNAGAHDAGRRVHNAIQRPGPGARTALRQAARTIQDGESGTAGRHSRHRWPGTQALDADFSLGGS